MLLNQKGDRCLHLSPFKHREHNKWTYEMFNSACLGLVDKQRGIMDPVGLNCYNYVIMEEPALSNVGFAKALHLLPKHMEIILIIGGLLHKRDHFSHIITHTPGVVRWSHVSLPTFVTREYTPELLSRDWKAEFLEEI